MVQVSGLCTLLQGTQEESRPPEHPVVDKQISIWAAETTEPLRLPGSLSLLLDKNRVEF